MMKAAPEGTAGMIHCPRCDAVAWINRIEQDGTRVYLCTEPRGHEIKIKVGRKA